jgi:hypothetical protein
MGNITKTFALLLMLIIAIPCLTFLAVKPSSAQPTPDQILPSSTFATPQTYYSVPPLSSLSLKIDLARGSPCRFSVYIKGGSGNDINLRIINSEGKIIYDLGRIINGTSFKFYADKPGNYTIILDNEFSVFSSKEVNVFQGNITFSSFEFAGFSISVWVIILLVIISLVALMTFVVCLRKHKNNNLVLASFFFLCCYGT